MRTAASRSRRSRRRDVRSCVERYPSRRARVRWQSDGRRGERARLTRVQDGWRVRVPASSANLGPAFDAVAVALGTHLEVLADGDDPAPETHPGRARVPQRRWARPALRPVAVSRAAAGLGFSAAARVAGLLAVHAQHGHVGARGAGRDVARRDRARGSRRQRGRRALRRRRRGRGPPRRAGAARARARGRRVDARGRDRDRRAPAGSSPTRCRSTTRCSTSAAPRCSSPRSRPARSTRCASRPKTACTRTGAWPAPATRAPRSRPCSTRARSRRGCRARDRRRRRSSTAATPTAIAAALPTGGRALVLDIDDEGATSIDMKLDGKCVVVTGAAGGIGAALARRFAAEGARGVVVADREPSGIERVAREIDAAAGVGDRGACDVTQGVADPGARRRGRGPLRPDRPVLLERGRHRARRRRRVRRTTGSAAST